MMLVATMIWIIDVGGPGGGIFLEMSRPQFPPTEGVDQ